MFNIYYYYCYSILLKKDILPLFRFDCNMQIILIVENNRTKWFQKYDYNPIFIKFFFNLCPYGLQVILNIYLLFFIDLDASVYNKLFIFYLNILSFINNFKLLIR